MITLQSSCDSCIYVGLINHLALSNRGQSSLHGLQGPAGPSMPRLAPPPRDAEVTELEQELERAAKKITELRGSMHVQLVSELSARLAAQRPKLAATEQEGSAAERDEPSALPGPALEGLAEKLAAASDSCPALRAQLEETLARLNRILGAVRSEAERAQQAGERGPATVERVLLARPGDDPIDNRGEAGAEQPGASVRRLLIDSLT